MMNDDTAKGSIDRTLVISDKEYALLLEVLSTRYAELLDEQSQGNTEPWLGDMIDEFEALNYKLHFIADSDIEDSDDNGYDELGMVTE